MLKSFWLLLKHKFFSKKEKQDSSKFLFKQALATISNKAYNELYNKYVYGNQGSFIPHLKIFENEELLDHFITCYVGNPFILPHIYGYVLNEYTVYIKYSSFDNEETCLTYWLYPEFYY